MSNNIITDTPDSPKRCFVIMGFGIKTDFATGRTLNLDQSYRLLIKPTAESKGLTCVRADEISSRGIIDVIMYQELLTADVVIADLSAMDPNALYELGVRHALRPHSTIVISESKLSYPFDSNHIRILSYDHLGNGIDFDEVERFRKVLGKTLDDVLENVRTDSPVYTYLQNLSPPTSTDAPTIRAKMLENTQASEQPDLTLATLIEAGEQAIQASSFSVAKDIFEKAITIKEDPYLLQRLVLATYKAEQPDRLSALLKARKLLVRLNPIESNDPQTIKLLGNIEFELYSEEHNINRLVRARQAYERMYAINRDYKVGITLTYIVSLHAQFREDDTEKIADMVIASRLRREVVELCKTKLVEIRTLRKIETPLSKAAIETTPDEEEFWVWNVMAEAYYGLNDIENYTNARNEAMLIPGASWMKNASASNIIRLDNLLKNQTQLFARVKKSLALEPPSVNMPFINSPEQGMGGEHWGGLKENQPSRNQIFISYSHNDKKWLKKLQTMLNPMIRNDTVTVWDDTLDLWENK